MSTKPYYRYAHFYLTLGLIIVLAGFSTTYFGNLGDFTFPYHLHGVSATLWMLLLIVQPYLFQKGKMKAHKILGWCSLVLVPLIIIGGLTMMRLMIQGQEFYPPDLVYQLAFIDALTLLGFAALYILALYHRKHLMLHSRLMVSTIFGPLIPALGRLFVFNLGIAPGLSEGVTYAYIFIEIVLFAIIFKERKIKAMRYTYLPFLTFVIAQHALMYYSNDWAWWKAVMDSFSNYSS